jgi:hypothetical protein
MFEEIIIFPREKKWKRCKKKEIKIKRDVWYQLISFILYNFRKFNVIFSLKCQNFTSDLMQITIYSDESLADEIWWTFYERTNWPSRKTSNMDYEFFSSFFNQLISFILYNFRKFNVIFSLKCQNFTSDLMQCYCAKYVCQSEYECYIITNY